MNKNSKKESISVKMVTPDNAIPTRKYQYKINGFQKLGKEIKISPKANATINAPGFKTEFFVETVNVVIGIGNDHTADLIMSIDAWEALLAGEEVSITTAKEFAEKYIHKSKKKK